MGYVADEYMSGAVIPEDMPDDLLGNPDVQRLIHNAYAVIETMEEWIDPDSEGYAIALQESREEGIDDTVNAVEKILSDAMYRRDMYGWNITLEELLGAVSQVKEKVIYS